MDAHLMLAIAEGCTPTPVAALLDPDADPRALLADPPTDLAPSVLRRLRDPSLAARALRIRAEAEQLGLSVLTPDHVDYPSRLRRAPLRPLVLFARGDPQVAEEDRRALAVVGSRTPTPYGLAAARDFASAAARAQVVIWSGLAFGIDAAAHEAALAMHTPTVAVQAGGLDEVQPPSHTALARRIVDAGGLLLSEAPPGMRPLRGHFPRRNRILASASEAVLVIEAGERSGALHTAHHAAELGVAVFAVPGPYTSPRSRGCHALLAEGAAIAVDPEAVMRALSIEGSLRDPHAGDGLERDADRIAVLTTLAQGPRPADLVMRESRLDAPRYLAAVMALLEEGAVIQLAGDLLARCRS
ncbi:MAG: DNA-processing protein DprA [Planctomycetota bacterium]